MAKKWKKSDDYLIEQYTNKLLKGYKDADEQERKRQQQRQREQAAQIATGSVTKSSPKSSNSSTSTKKSSYASSGVSQRASNNTRTTYAPQRGGHIPTTVQNSYGVQRRGTTISGRSSGRGDKKQNAFGRVGRTLKGSAKQFAGGHLSSVGSNLQTQEVTARSIHNAKADNRTDDYKLRSRADAEKREQSIQKNINKKEGVDTVKALEWRDRNMRNPLENFKNTAKETANAYKNARADRGEQSYSLRSREDAEKTRNSAIQNLGRKEGVDIRNVERPKKERPNEFPKFDEYSPSRKLINTGDRLIESGSRDIEKAKEGTGAVGRFLIDATANASQMLGDRAVGLVGDLIVPGMGTALSMGSLMNRAGGTASYEARQKGADPDQQFRYGLGVSLVEGLSEGVFNSVSAFRSTYGKGAFNLADRVSKRVAASNIVRNYFDSPMGRSFIINASRLGAQGLEEGSEEVIADIIEPLLEKAITGDSDGIELKQMIYDFMVGAFMGAVPGAVDVGRNVRTDMAIQNAMSEGRLNEDDYINRGLVQGRTGQNATNAELLARELQEQKAQGKEVLPSQVRMMMQANAEAESSNTYEFNKRRKEEYAKAVEEGRADTVQARGTYEETKAFNRRVNEETAKSIEQAKEVMGENASEESARAVAKVTVGGAQSEDIDTILLDNDARRAVEELEKVSLPEDNREAREVLENLTVNNQINNRDTYLNESHEQIRSEMSKRGGALFDEHYDEAIESLDLPNAPEIYDSIFSRFYSAGTVQDSDFNESYDRIVTNFTDMLGEGESTRVSNFFNKAFAQKIFDRGREAMAIEKARAKSKSETYKASNEEVGFKAVEGAEKYVSERMSKNLDKMAKRLNVPIRLVTSIEGGMAHGKYEGGVIYIAADSNRKFLTIAKHELTHHLKATAFDRYQELEDFVFKKWYNSDAEEMESRIKKVQDLYGCTPEEAREEIIADAAEAFFTDEGAIDDAISFSEKLGKAISDGIHSLLDTFIYIQDSEDKRRQSTNDGDFLKTLDILRDAEQMWLKALDESANREKGTNEQNEVQTETEAKKSLKARDESYMDAVNRGDMETAQRMVDEAAKREGYNSPLLYSGSNYFGFTKIDANVHGGDGSFWASNREDTSGTYTVLNRSRRISSQMSEEEEEKYRDELYEETESRIDDAIDEFRGLIDRTFSEWYFGQQGNNSIRDAVMNANPEAGYGDGVYDVLDEIVVDAYYQYQDDFANDYEDLIDWQENSPEAGEIYEVINGIESLRSTLKDIEYGDIRGGIYQLYANTDNMYELDAKGTLWNNLRPEGLPKLDRYGIKDAPYKTRDVVEWAKNNGYDGVIFRNIKDNGKYGRTGASDVYAFLNPNAQVKSADPVTYDDNGNVIPLSERFNENNEDIRYSKKTEEESLPKGGKIPKSLEKWAKQVGLDTLSKQDSRAPVKVSVRALRSYWYVKNGRNDEARTVNESLRSVSNALQKLAGKYKYIGLDDSINATVHYRTDEKGRPTSVYLTCQVKNAEYEINYDFTTICAKRAPLQKVLERFIKTEGERMDTLYDELKLDEEGMYKLRLILEQAGFEVSCIACFVEQNRYSQQAQAETVATDWNKALDEWAKENGTNISERFDLANLDLNNIPYEDIKKGFTEYYRLMREWKAKHPNDSANVAVKNRMLIEAIPFFRKRMNPSEYASIDGQRALMSMGNKKTNLYNLLKRGQGYAKQSVPFVAYNGEIALLPDRVKGKSLFNYLMSIGGARAQSASDFQIEYVFDYMQMVADLSARRLPMHMYTKVIELAELFGKTGIKINLSAMCDVDNSLDGEYAGLKKVNGRYVYNISNQSIDYKKAVQLQRQEGYSKNIGIIMVTLSKYHMLKALSDNDVRYIIGYHSSKMPAVVSQASDMESATDYTKINKTNKLNDKGRALFEKAMSMAKGDTELERYKNALRIFDDMIQSDVGKGKSRPRRGNEYARYMTGYKGNTADFDVYADIKKTGDPRKTADNYIQYCMDNDLVPMYFPFAFHENYYKCEVYDFNMFDNNTGEYAPMEAVQNIYPGLDMTKGETDTTEFMDKVSKHMDAQNKKNKKLEPMYEEVERKAKEALRIDIDGNDHVDMDATGIDPSELKHRADAMKESNDTAKLSRKSPDSTSTLSTQNTIAKLEEQVKDLKAEFKRTNLKTANQKDVRIQAGRLIQRHGSNMQTQKSLMDTFNKIFSLYKEKGTDAFDEVYEIAKDEAVNIVNNIGVIHNEGAEEYKAIKQYLRETPIQIDDAMKRNITDYNDFRKSNFGRLKLVNGETSNIDNVYMELMELFPEQFTEDYTNPHDQLNHIVDVLDNFAPYYESLDGASEEMQDYVVMIASDIMETAYGLQTKKTFADRMHSKVEKYQEELWLANERTAAERMRGEMDIQKAREEALASRKRALERQRNRYEKKLDTLKEKHQDFKAETRENAEKKRRIKQISNVYKRLLEKLQTPSDTKHLPDGYEPVVSNVLKMFDFTTPGMMRWAGRHGEPTKRYKYMTELRKQLDEMSKNDTGVEVDPDLLELVDEIMADIGENQKLIDLDSRTLEDIATLFRAFEHQINTYNKAFDEANRQTIIENRDTFFEQVRDKKDRKDRQGTIGWLQRQLETNNTTPEDFFHLVGGVPEKLYKSIRKGFDKHILNVRDAMDFISSVTKGKDIQKWSENVKEYTTSFGESIKLTDAQLMSIYCLSKREQAQKHMYSENGGGGIAVAPQKVGKGLKAETIDRASVIVNSEDIKRWTSQLSEEQINVADQFQTYLSENMSDLGNETSMKLFGYKKFTEKFYFPIQSSDDWLNSTFDFKGGDPVLKNTGMTKALNEHANNPIVIDDIFTVASKHISTMSLYNSLVPALTDFQRFWNSKDKERHTTVQKEFIRVYGTPAYKYVENFMGDLNGAYKKGFEVEGIDKLMSKYKQASIGLNLRVLFQQPTAVARAGAVMNPLYITKALASSTTTLKKNMKDMREHCPIALWKSWGFYNTDLARDMRSIMMNEKSFSDNFSKAYGIADDLTWSVIFKAVRYEVEAQNKNLEVGSDEYWEKVNERASEVFDRTQVVDSPFHRSQNMRAKDNLSKMVTAFMAEPTKTYNMLKTELTLAKREITSGQKAKGLKRASRVVQVFVTNAVLVSASSAVIDALRGVGGSGDDDKDKDWWERFLAHWLSNTKDNVNPLGLLPVFKDVQSVVDGYDVTRMDMQAIGRMVKSLQYMGEYIKDPENSKFTLFNEADYFLQQSAYLVGLPYANLRRDVRGIAFSIAEAVGYDDLFFEEAKLKYQVNDKTKSMWADMYLDAKRKGNKTLADKIHDYIVDGGITQEYIDDREHTYKRANKTDAEQQSYDKSMATLENSDIWKNASADNKEYYTGVVTNLSVGIENKNTEYVTKLAKNGVTNEQVILYKLALKQADAKANNNGSYDKNEKAEALRMLMREFNLTKSQQDAIQGK